jgi:protease PrsW
VATQARPALRRPRWGHQTSLFQIGQPAFWLFLVLLLLTGILTVAEQSIFRRIAPGGWALSWVLLLIYALPVFLVVYFLDLYEREPISLVIGALLWGAVAAPALAGLANDGWGLVVARLGGPEFASRWAAAFTAPFVEETLKALGVILIALIARDEIDDMMDGFVYGAMVGLGFTVVEDVFYFIGVFGGSPSGVLTGFFLRVVSSGLYGHVLYTGLTGMGIAYFLTRRGEASRAKRWAVAVGLVGVAVFGHFLWNSPWLDFFPRPPWHGTDWLIVPLATAVKGIPLLVFVGVMVTLARRREARWLDAALAGEVGRLGLLPEELAMLGSPRARRRALREMKRRAGPAAARLLKRLQKQQINLAMIRTRVDQDDHPDLVRQREYIASLRAALRAIPGAAPAAPTPTPPA